MEPKKYSKSDLQEKSGLFFNIGLVVGLVLVISAFEWKFKESGALADLGMVAASIDELLIIPPTIQPPPPPPRLQHPQVIEIENDELIDEEIDFHLDIEATEETVIEDIVYVEPEKEETEEVVLFPEQQATPVGGFQAYYAAIGKNLKYPKAAERMGIEGKVFVQFVVDKDGSVTDVQVLKGIGGGCDEEAVRIIKEGPKWNPGKQRGRAVKVRMVIPVVFQLQR